MGNWLIERRLKSTAAKLRDARAELAVLNEQVDVVSDEAEDARLRAIVSEHQQDLAEHTSAKRQADVMTRARIDAISRIESLTKLQDDLLDQLARK